MAFRTTSYQDAAYLNKFFPYTLSFIPDPKHHTDKPVVLFTFPDVSHELALRTLNNKTAEVGDYLGRLKDIKKEVRVFMKGIL